MNPAPPLPSFTPVVFSTAFSTGAGNAVGNPVTGDTNNISVSGRNLTSVALRSNAVEIDYAGDWFQLHPETVFDHASQQISVVSRTPNNLDLFVIGFDNVVYSAAWSADSGWSGW